MSQYVRLPMSNPELEQEREEQDNARCIPDAGKPAHGGWRLALSSALVFLLPALGMIAGSSVAEENARAPLLGACAGFLIGAALAWLIVLIWRPQKMEQDQ